MNSHYLSNFNFFATNGILNCHLQFGAFLWARTDVNNQAEQGRTDKLKAESVVPVHVFYPVIAAGDGRSFYSVSGNIKGSTRPVGRSRAVVTVHVLRSYSGDGRSFYAVAHHCRAWAKWAHQFTEFVVGFV